MDDTMSSFKIENLYKMYTIIYIYMKVIYLHIYLVVSFQGQSITYLMAYPIIYNGTSWPSRSKNGKEALAIVLELTATNKVSSAIGMLRWSVTSQKSLIHKTSRLGSLRRWFHLSCIVKHTKIINVSMVANKLNKKSRPINLNLGC